MTDARVGELLHFLNMLFPSYFSQYLIGDTVNILGSFQPVTPRNPLDITFNSKNTPTSRIAITTLKNTIILHPDLLLPATAVSNGSQCSRKPLLTALVPPPITAPNPSMVWGNMLHEVVQKCMAEGKWDKQFLESSIDEVVRSEYGLGELVKVEVGVEGAKDEVRARAVGLEGFSRRFISLDGLPKVRFSTSGPLLDLYSILREQNDAELSDVRSHAKTRSFLSLTGLHDIEEDIWSPTYGLKGKLDASIQASIEEKDDSLGRSQTTSWTMPFEIKTGRAITGLEHRAQTMIYTLLMRERYGKFPSTTQREQLIILCRRRGPIWITLLYPVRSSYPRFIISPRDPGSDDRTE